MVISSNFNRINQFQKLIDSDDAQAGFEYVTNLLSQAREKFNREMSDGKINDERTKKKSRENKATKL